MIIGLLLVQCNKEKDLPQKQVTQQESVVVQMEPNPSPDEIGEIPAATVALKTFEPVIQETGSRDGSSLAPELLEATLAAEESVGELKTGIIDGAPPRGDIMVCFDLTGSMGEELENAKANALNITNAIEALIPDTWFGLISHMDYLDYYSGCGYSANYGYTGDYPYSLDQPLTDDNTLFSDEVNALSLGSGYDFPEDYTRALYETYADPGIGWRVGTKKIVVAILDAVPHDCDFDAVIGGAGTTGPDPGRDEVIGGGDDLEILTVLDQMASNNITLIVLYSGTTEYPELNYLSLWEAYTAITGGTAFQINTDGTIPDGSNIAEAIVALIEADVSELDEVTLEVCTPGYETWLTEILPPSYIDVVLVEPWTGGFDITVTVPAGTVDGLYEFDICLMGDGVEYGRQNVSITVQNFIEVPFDIHPTSCPNPVNRKGGGVMPAAILGSDTFDVMDIDPATINIGGVYPVRTAIEDVATPYYPFIGKDLDKMSCNTYGPDGYSDLTIKFSNQEIAALLNGYVKDDVVKLELTGELYDGTDIIGEDIIIIVK